MALGIRGIGIAVVLTAVAVAQSPLRRVDRPLPADELVAPADYDNDGDIDGLAWTDGVFDGRILANDGHARFTAVPAVGLAFPPGVAASQTLAADFNGDGYGDVLVHDRFGTGSAPGNQLWLGAPGYTFTAGPPLPVVAPWPYGITGVASMAAGDVNLDGLPDLVVGVAAYSINWGDSVPELWLNAGGGAFAAAPATVFSPGVAPSTRVVVRDLDGDGWPDVRFGSGGAFTTSFALRNVAGTFFPYPGYPAPASGYPGDLAEAADFNGDGLADLAYVVPVATPASGGSLLVSMGGAGGFGPWTISNLPAIPPISLPAGLSAVDADADGTSELLGFATFGSYLLDVGPTGVAGAVLGIYPGNLPKVTAWADLDQDGDRDAVLGRGGAHGAPGFLMNSGAGALFPIATRGGPDGLLVTSTMNPAPIYGDFDGDQVIDVVDNALLGYGGIPALRTALADGAGGFSYPTNYVLGAPFSAGLVPTRSRAAADFDLDGDVDLYVRGRTNFPYTITDVLFLNQGGFGPGVALPPQPGATPAMWAASVACDLDLDGYPDVLMADLHSVAATTTVLAHNLGGTFAAAAPLGAPQRTRDLLVGDFDGDGDRDVLLVGASSAPAAPSILYRAQPGGPVASTLAGLSGEYGAVGDLNGDGTDDVVLDGVVYLFAAGVPTAGPLLPSALRAPALLADLDGDGDLDLVETPATVMMNSGGAVFGPPESALPRRFGSSFLSDIRSAAADVDRDGDLDVIAPGPTVVLNVSRHLVHDGVPRLGRPTGVHLFGTPGAPFALFAAPTAVLYPLPPFGILQIDPNSAVLVATGSFAPAGGVGAGEASVPLFVPNASAYLGLTLHWQALDLGPVRLTNLLTSVVASF